MQQPAAGSEFRKPNILIAFDWFDERIYRGIVRYAKEADWHISPYLISGRFIPYGWPGDGVITCYGKILGDFIDSLEMPKVDVSFSPIDPPVPRVQVDNVAIGKMAARHFVERGFRKFAFFHWPMIDVNRMRRDAFFSALKEEGFESESLHHIEQAPDAILSDWRAHQAFLLQQLRDLPRPLAVFAAQDNLASTLMECCLQNGIHVPEEVAILGVDNIELICEGLMVPLSSIDTRLEELGYKAAARLGQYLDGDIDAQAEPILIAPGGIVCRQSTDILAVDHPLVVRALKFMKEHLHEPVTLEEIAEQIGMSKRGLEKAFLKHLERTPAEALRRLRLDAAKQQLAESDAKIEVIAEGCGYSNSSNLSAAYRKETGLSPRAYREQFRQ